MRVLALRALGVVAVVLALVLTTSAVSADADQRDRGRPDRGCHRSLSAGTQTLQVRFQGVAYPVRLVVPAGISPRTSLPLVLDLHGSSSNGVAQAPISDLTTLAGQEKFLVANPSGAIALAPANPPLPDGSWAWNVPGVPTTAGQFPPAGARDDVQFLKTVIATVDKLGLRGRLPRLRDRLLRWGPDGLGAGLRAGRHDRRDRPRRRTPGGPSVATRHECAGDPNARRIGPSR